MQFYIKCISIIHRKWYNVAIGTSDDHIDITLANKDSVIDVELYIKDNKELFDKLYQKKDEIDCWARNDTTY